MILVGGLFVTRTVAIVKACKIDGVFNLCPEDTWAEKASLSVERRGIVLVSNQACRRKT